MNKNVLRTLSYGVYIVSTMDGSRPTGCVANSAMQISGAPASIAVSIHHDNYTHGCIEKSGIFSLSIMAENSPVGVIGTFGYQSGKDIDKFNGVNYEMVAGAPVLKDGCGYIVCKVVDKIETATHTVFLGEVLEGDVIPGAAKEMTYSYFHNVVKAKSPKNAPTFIDESETPAPAPTVKKFVCTICGFIYEGEALPSDYICPICKQGADKFVEQQ